MKKYTHFRVEFTVEGEGQDPLPSPSVDDFLAAMSKLLKKTCPSVEAILPGLRVRVSDRTHLYRKKSLPQDVDERLAQAEVRLKQARALIKKYGKKGAKG